MSEPYVGEIRMFGGNFAPVGWAFCDGQLLAVSENDALFSLLGTIYGGDGRTTFGLPDLRGRVPVHAGAGSGLSQRPLGQQGGAENVTLTTPTTPAHSHPLSARATPATTRSPGGNVLAQPAVFLYTNAPTTPLVAMAAEAISSAPGGSQDHPNLMPALCVNFIISLYGIYPSRQ